MKHFGLGETTRPAIAAALFAVGLLGAGMVNAQDTAASLVDEIVPDSASLASLQQRRIPALTPVAIRIHAELGSKISKSGDIFPISLAEPIVIDGRELVPAGITGMGEVVHAKKGGFGGAPGELVLAARYLELNGRQIRLRSFSLHREGKDNLGLTSGVAIAAGLPALFINGGNAVVPSGTVSNAKLREDFNVEISPPVPGDDVVIEKEGGE